MFGSKRRREEREQAIHKESKKIASRRPNLVEAVREAISSPTNVVLRPPGAKIYGGEGRCAIQPKDWASSHGISRTFTELQRALGRDYTYGIHVSAQCPSFATQVRHQLSPGWRTYADEYTTIYRNFSSIAEFTRWVLSSESIGTRDHRYSINVGTRNGAKLLKKT